MSKRQVKPASKTAAKKVAKTANFHARLSAEQEARFLAAINKSPKDLRIKSKTDLFNYMLETFCDAVGA